MKEKVSKNMEKEINHLTFIHKEKDSDTSKLINHIDR